MMESQTPDAASTEAIPLAWTKGRPPPKGSNYYKGLKDKYGNFIDENELLPVPALMKMVNTRSISLLTTDIKTHRLIGSNREIMEEALKISKMGV